MTKVRIGNDFVFAWAITRDGSPENFTGATEKLHVKGSVLSEFKTKNTDPTTTDIPTGYTMLVKNTTSGIP